VTDDDLTIDDEVRALIGKVVTRLLGPDRSPGIHDIIEGLHHLRVRSADRQTRLSCKKAIHILTRKLH